MLTRIENFITTQADGIQVFDVHVIGSYTMSMQSYRNLVSAAAPRLIHERGRAYQGKTLLVQKGEALKTNDHWALEVGLLPSITDNTSETVRQMIMDTIRNCTKLDPERVDISIISKKLFVGGLPLPSCLDDFFNPLINTLKIFYPLPKLFSEDPEDIGTRQPTEQHKPSVQDFEMRVSDESLLKINQERQLGLNIDALRVIREHFSNLGRLAQDIELETIAQTWSEHCKHITFSSPIDEIEAGLYRHYLKRSTYQIMEEKKDFCISVFDDNAGAIKLSQDWSIAAKVETHNTPSALEPFSGALTGILGVNRDILGFGRGAKPIANSYGFCFAPPDIARNIYYQQHRPIIHPRKIAREVIKGVMVGGNCSGIPTMQGFIRFHEGYLAKPLVFVGSLGLIPATINGRPGSFKQVKNGDLIVIIGGRTGRDGIHGANFSSAAASWDTPYAAVQTGDAITQKKLSDAIICEIRDQGLYNSITDNGAGGLSSSVGEMGREGFCVDLEKLLLKFAGMDPWEMWISESQERMTLAVPECNLCRLSEILTIHDVELCVIGTFNDTKRGIVRHQGKVILDLDTEFLHSGNPLPRLSTAGCQQAHHQPLQQNPDQAILGQTDLMQEIYDNINLRNNGSIAEMYDHEVQGTSLLKPLQGQGKIRGMVTALRPVLSLEVAVAQTQSLAMITENAQPYQVASRAIAITVTNLVAHGANPEKIALLDNFCWSDPHSPKRLWQLKECARACHDGALRFKSPFISGKDSMFNDFKGFDDQGQPVSLSNLPTLLISGIGIIEHAKWCISMDVKQPGDLLCFVSNKDGSDKPLMHQCYYDMIQEQIISSAIANDEFGIKYAILRKLVAGNLGAKISQIDHLSSISGILITIDPRKRALLDKMAGAVAIQVIGEITDDQQLIIGNQERYDLGLLTKIINTDPLSIKRPF